MEILEKNQIETSGKLQAFKANKHRDIHAMEVTNGQGTIKVNFPPHTAEAIMNAVKQGESLTLIYIEEKLKHDPKGDKKPRLKLQSLVNSTNHKVSTGGIHPGKPDANQSSENLHFENFELIKGKKGELTGIRSGKQLVHIHKEDQEIADKINTDSKIEIIAVKRTAEGFVNENQDEVYHIRKIAIDGKYYQSKK